MSITHDVNLSGLKGIFNDFGGDIGREFLFSVNIPSIVGRNFNRSTMTAFCQSARIPEFKIITKKLPYQKVDINLADGINFLSWTPTFLSDDSSILRTNLLTWSSVCWDYNRKGAATPRSYKREIEIQQLNRVGRPTCKYTLVGAYPESVGGFSMDNNSKNLAKFDVVFQYDYFFYESYDVLKEQMAKQQVTQILNGKVIQ